MKRALLALLVAAGCTPTVLLGSLSLDGGGGGNDIAGCPVCDFGPTQLDAFPGDGDFGGSDLADGGGVDLAH